MKETADKHHWFFVDEAGDPAFYAKGKKLIVGTHGCSKTFSVGFIRTLDPERIRTRMNDIRLGLAQDRYLKDVPSMAKTLECLHAKDDCPEVRKIVFDALDGLDFRVQVIVGRKLESIFHNQHKESQDRFYDDLVSKLFQRQLHLASKNTIVFSRRGNKARQHSLRKAVEAGAVRFRAKYKSPVVTDVSIETSQPMQDAALQAVDYALWAVQRAFERGEMRYFEFLRDKIELVWDVYDIAKFKNANPPIYDRRRNPFHIDKVTPFAPQPGYAHGAETKKPVPLAKAH